MERSMDDAESCNTKEKWFAKKNPLRKNVGPPPPTPQAVNEGFPLKVNYSKQVLLKRIFI